MYDAQNAARGREQGGDRSVGEKLVRQVAVYALISGPHSALQEKRQQSSGGNGKGEVVDRKEHMESAAWRRGSQEPSEEMRVVMRNVSRKRSAACSERTRSENVEIKAFGDRQRESSAGIANAGVAEDEEGVGTAGAWRSAKKAPEGKRVATRNNGKMKERRGEGFHSGPKKKPKETSTSYLLRMVVSGKFYSVKEALKTMAQNHCSFRLSL